jgi:glyceraldehyde 3-phosphate dehydrogenase
VDRPRIGLNGFGRIGRALTRVNRRRRVGTLVAVNDSLDVPANLHYLLLHDSVYGRYEGTVGMRDSNTWILDGTPIAVSSAKCIDALDWCAHDVDVLIDAATALPPREVYDSLLEAGVPRIIITSPYPDADATVVIGVNDALLSSTDARLISTSSCDCGAVAPLLFLLDEAFGVLEGVVTTLHPWLGYQQLLDAPVRRESIPVEYWHDYALGRASTLSLIPKRTSMLQAVAEVLPEVASRLQSMSFRVPTAAVSAAQLAVRLGEDTSVDEVNQRVREAAVHSILDYGDEHLVSIDHLQLERPLYLDGRWTSIRDRHAMLLAWYDNEWGYASSVLTIVEQWLRGDIVAPASRPAHRVGR